MSWRWSRAWRTCAPSVCLTWSRLPVRAHTSWPRAARGWSMDPWDARRALICWWVASEWTGSPNYLLLYIFSVKSGSSSRHTKRSERLTTPKHTTPFRPNTDTPSDSHSFVTPMFSITSPRLPLVPQCLGAVHYLTVIPSWPHQSHYLHRDAADVFLLFPLQPPASCAFLSFFVAHCQPAPLIPPNLVQGWVHSGKLCLFSTSCRYRRSLSERCWKADWDGDRGFLCLSIPVITTWFLQIIKTFIILYCNIFEIPARYSDC